MNLTIRNTHLTSWLIPLTYAGAALLLGSTVPRLSYTFAPLLLSTMSANAAIGIYSSIASGMLALTGIVFSLTFLMVQFSATAYSPRLVLWISRDPIVSHSIGVFTATFLYALASLAWVDRAGSGRVPLVNAGIVTGLLVASMIMFVALIHRVGVLQVSRMLTFTGNQGRGVIDQLYPPIEAASTRIPPASRHWLCSQTVVHHGAPRIVQAMDVPRLTEIATSADCVLQVVAAVGDTVLDSTPMVRVFACDGCIPEERLASAILLGDERTFEQDPKYAIRLLVDIAIKALSPAVNDPTTAVQALDQIEDLLIRLGRRRLEIGAFSDRDGQLRVLIAFPAWEDFLRLAFDEVCYYGATSIQVMRRMRALLSELLAVLPEERSSALRYWKGRLESTVARTFTDKDDVLDASAEDRQGLGSCQQPRHAAQ